MKPGGNQALTRPGAETGVKVSEEQAPALKTQADSAQAAALGQANPEQTITAAPKGVDAGALKNIAAEKAALKDDKTGDTLGASSKALFDAQQAGTGKVSGPSRAEVLGKTQSSPEQVRSQVDLFVGEGERLADKNSPTASQDAPKAPFAYEKALEATEKALSDKVITPEQGRELGGKIHQSMLKQVRNGSMDQVAQNIRAAAGQGSAGETAFKTNVGSLDKWNENFGIRWRPLLGRNPSLPLVRNSKGVAAEINKAEKELASKPAFPRIWYDDQKDETFIAGGLPKIPRVPKAQTLARPIEGSPEAAALSPRPDSRAQEPGAMNPLKTGLLRIGKSLYEAILSLLRKVVRVNVDLGEGVTFRSGEFAAKRLVSLRRELSEQERGYLKEAAGSPELRLAFLDLGPVRQNLLQASRDPRSLEWLARTYAQLSRRGWPLLEAARLKKDVAARAGIDRFLDHVGKAIWDWADRRFLLILEKEGRLHFIYGDLSSPQGTVRIVSRATLSEPLLQGLKTAGFSVKDQEGEGFWTAFPKIEEGFERLPGMLSQALALLSGKTRATPPVPSLGMGAAVFSELAAFLRDEKSREAAQKDAWDPRWIAEDPAQVSPVGMIHVSELNKDFFVALHAKPGQAPYYRLTDTGDTTQVYVRQALPAALARSSRPSPVRLPVAR